MENIIPGKEKIKEFVVGSMCNCSRHKCKNKEAMDDFLVETQMLKIN